MIVIYFLPSSTTDLGQGELNTPDLTLVAQTVFADDLQFGVARFRQGMMLDKGYLRHKQREQAHAQWPGYTYRRADSNAVVEDISLVLSS